MASLSDRLAALDSAVADASERRQRAWHRRQNEYEISVDATAPLTAYRDEVSFRKRQPDVEEQRRLTRELCERIEANGFVVEAAGGGAGMLIVRDPAVMDELEDAMKALDAAKQVRRAFARKHADEIRAETDAEAMDELRSALDGDDPARLREALAAR